MHHSGTGVDDVDSSKGKLRAHLDTTPSIDAVRVTQARAQHESIRKSAIGNTSAVTLLGPTRPIGLQSAG